MRHRPIRFRSWHLAGSSDRRQRKRENRWGSPESRCRRADSPWSRSNRSNYRSCHPRPMLGQSRAHLGKAGDAFAHPVAQLGFTLRIEWPVRARREQFRKRLHHRCRSSGIAFFAGRDEIELGFVAIEPQYIVTETAQERGQTFGSADTVEHEIGGKVIRRGLCRLGQFAQGRAAVDPFAREERVKDEVASRSGHLLREVQLAFLLKR